MAYGEALVSTGDFPELTALAEHARRTGSGMAPLEHLERQFETGLAALLDGIEQHYAIS
jgi:hypothetical protein